MRIFLVDTGKVFDSMESTKAGREEIERLRREVLAEMENFDTRSDGYKRTLNSPLILSEAEKVKTAEAYKKDYEDTQARVSDMKMTMEVTAASVNEASKVEFEAALEKVVSGLDGYSYVVLRTEETLASYAPEAPNVQGLRESNGADITGLVIESLK